MHNHHQHIGFEQSYLSIREQEGRLLSDADVAQLPFLKKDHPLWQEWKLRAVSCKRLLRFLAAKKKPLEILEVGCGNGWLCNRLLSVPHANVTGIDINRHELAQAARLFKQVQFAYGDLQDLYFSKKFDAIIFAASFQYFSSVNEIMKACFEQLSGDGEIHILDTHLYTEKELVDARVRSCEYFTGAGFPQMNAFYFHHSFSELQAYNYRLLYRPKSFLNRFVHQNPFPWICIKR